MTLGSFLAKVIGGTALYYSAKDVNRFGIAVKNKNPQAKIAQSFPDMYINTQRIELSNTLLPTIVGDAKKGYFDFYLRDNWFPFIYGITGYIKGIAIGLAHNIIPIGLAVGALAFSKGGHKIKDPATGKFLKGFYEKIKDKKTGTEIIKKIPFLKRTTGKVCAGLLIFGALKSFITNVCGVGDYQKL